MKQTKFIISTFVILIICTSIISCGVPTATTNTVPGITKDQILIGSILGYTSPETAGAAEAIDHGANTYFNIINEKGGILGRKIKWITEDDAAQTDKSIALAKKMVEQDKIFALLSLNGISESIAIQPYLTENGVPMFAEKVLALEQPVISNVFLHNPATERLVYFYVDWAITQLGAKRFANLSMAGPFEQIKKLTEYRLKQAGLSYVMPLEEFNFSTDFSGLAAKVKAADPDIVIFGGIPPAAAAFLKEAQKQGLKPKYGFISHDVNFDFDLIRLGGSATEGFMATQTFSDPTSLDPDVKEYRDQLAKYYPKDLPGTKSLSAYHRAKIFCEAMTKAGPDPTREKYIKALESMGGMNLGLAGPLGYSATQHVALMRARMNVVKNGQWSPISDWIQLPTSLPTP